MSKTQNYSNEALDILGKVPNTYLRYGLSFFLIVLIGIAVSLYFIRYQNNFIIPVKVYSNKTEDDRIFYLAYGELRAEDISKIYENDEVCITLNSYFSEGYDVLYGKVLDVSKIDSLFSYKIVIEINAKSKLNKGDLINKSPQVLEGNATFKRNEQNIYQRIFLR